MGKCFNIIGVDTRRLRALTLTGYFLTALIATHVIAAFVHADPGEDFTIVVLPDTQYYSESYPNTFYSQTEWIVDNKDELNIVYVAHLGDLVENANLSAEWDVANAAMTYLEVAGIPYGVLPGNHDQPTNLYNQYFGPDRFLGRDYYGGSYAVDSNDNNFTLFSAGGMDFIVINLAYGSSTDLDALDWADQLLKNWSVRRAIVVAHNILSVGDPAAFTSEGQAIFNALKTNPNLFSCFVATRVPRATGLMNFSQVCRFTLCYPIIKYWTMAETVGSVSWRFRRHPVR